MNLNERIQECKTLDLQLKLLNDKVLQLREKKHDLNAQIIQYIENNNIQPTNYKIKINKMHVASQLSFKYLEKKLGDIIKNPSQVEQIVTYLKQKREIKVVTEIKHL